MLHEPPRHDAGQGRVAAAVADRTQVRERVAEKTAQKAPERKQFAQCDGPAAAEKTVPVPQVAPADRPGVFDSRGGRIDDSRSGFFGAAGPLRRHGERQGGADRNPVEKLPADGGSGEGKLRRSG